MREPCANAAGAASERPAMRVDVAILGARMHYAVARTLAQAGLLGTLYTDTYIGNKPYLRCLLARVPARYRPGPIRKLLGREAPELCSGRIVSFDALGLRVKWSAGRIRSNAELRRYQAKYNRTFCEGFVRAGLSGARAVYALNGAALEIFQHAKSRGMLCILEQASAPSRIECRLLAGEAERWPGAQPAQYGEADGDPLMEREEAEWALADRVVCGSEFVAAGLQSLGLEKTVCRVLPYGVDIAVFRAREARGSESGLNVLFAGGVGLQKGVLYLLEALRRLDNPAIHCKVVGSVELMPGTLEQHRGEAEIIGAVPRSDMIRMYDWADVFVLPSICEGSALVTYEALACGLPVITTPNSGSVVRDGIDGFVVPIRDADAIASGVQRLFDDRELLRTMSANARRRSEEFSLGRYADQFRKLVAFDLELGNRTAAPLTDSVCTGLDA
jgi:Glycosyl transferases group 1